MTVSAALRVFLTGGTGFLGGRLARLLLAEGHAVTALVREPARARAQALAAAGARLHPGDVGDPAALRSGLRGCDAAFHVAGWYRVGVLDGREAQAANVSGTRNVLTALREACIPRAVYTSTLAVYSDTRGAAVAEGHPIPARHLSIYDATKAEAHALAEHFIADGLPLTIVQPGAIYGPGDRSDLHDALVRTLRGRQPAVPSGTAFCWAHVDDVARGHLLALDRGRAGRSYHLAGPIAGLAEALLRAADLAGARPPRVVPPGLLRVAAPLLGALHRFVPLPASYTGEALRVAAGTTYLGSCERARGELGWRARDFWPAWEELIREELAALRA